MRSVSGSCLILISMLSSGFAAELRGRVIDSDTGERLAARVYLRNANGEWLFVKSTDPDRPARPYREQWVPMPQSVELHTTVEATDFQAILPAGEYSIEVERGKEYHPFRKQIQLDETGQDLTIRLKRWINMAERGWYSGETHVHRRLEELPNVMQAEDLNVAFPVTFWTVNASQIPGLEPSPLRRQGPSPFGPRSDHGFAPIKVDPTHVILPRNTEYEIFSVNGKRHVLGAIFILNHRNRMTLKAPPIRAIAEQAHAEGALLDLDKHSWPWAMMLVPIAKIDLFELSNNSVWRTKFGFRRTVVPPAEWMNLEHDGPDTLTEWGWLNYGFEVYYSLLNCGFRISPTAGTASGVHPVPLGYSRVYVQTGQGFSANGWLNGLRDGRSFVTTGPMLLTTVDDQLPGTVRRTETKDHQVMVDIDAQWREPLDRVEVLNNGRVVHTIRAERSEESGRRATRIRARVPIILSQSCWLAVRTVAVQPDGRKRFAHTAPWYFEFSREAIRPRKQQVEFLMDQITAEIDRNREVLPEEALNEFKEALMIYRKIRERAEED